MRIFVHLFVTLFLCAAFVADKNPTVDPVLLAGKWKMTGEYINGTLDTTNASRREIFYEFRSDNVFILSFRHDNDTTLYHIGGNYHYNAKRNRVTVHHFDKYKTTQKYYIQELSSGSLILIERGNEKRNKPEFENRFVRVE